LGNLRENCFVKVVTGCVLDFEIVIFEGNCGYLDGGLRGEEVESVDFDDFG
jgi:hypothetical protein